MQMPVEKTLQSLNLEDDFLFAKVMSDSEICRRVLEKILRIPIKKVMVPTAQRTIDILLESKGIRLDVYVNDERGTVYNIEMQRGRKKELPKRSRYYAGCIDLDLIMAGKEYWQLKKSFIIFICTFDPFHEKRHIYTFENRCLENLSLSLKDDSVKIFLNTKGKQNDIDIEMQEFLSYIEDSSDQFAERATSPLIREIRQKVKQIKESRETEVEYMTLLQRDRENREEGAASAIRILKLYSKNFSVEKIAETLNMDPEYVAKVIADYENALI